MKKVYGVNTPPKFYPRSRGLSNYDWNLIYNWASMVLLASIVVALLVINGGK